MRKEPFKKGKGKNTLNLCNDSESLVFSFFLYLKLKEVREKE
ncbi:hypothetical protein KIS4809_0085 [Bacillus sp. ZZV12-4809]|nr:hypothetical protein KIS4809_0085 [Bacillus sp. ZZV12-4809]